MRRFIYPVLIILAGVLIAGLLVATGPKIESRPQQNLAPLVRVINVEPSAYTLNAITHGTVVPATEAELIPEVSGRVLEQSPDLVSGGFFEAGEVLLVIDPLDYEVALEEARAGLARAESELANARKVHTRQINLAQKQSTSDADRDDALNRLRIAEATLRERKARLARAERDISRTKMVAPFNGRVRSERVDAGQFVNRGQSIAMVYATDFAEVRLPVHDEELRFLDIDLNSSVRRGGSAEPVTATLRASFAGRDHAWEAVIVRTEGELDPRTRMINLIASVASPYATTGNRPPLAVGLFVEAQISGRQFDNVVALPRSALRDANHVYVVGADNRLEFRPVSVLRTVGETIYVNDGLKQGDRVCVSPLETALEGMPVRVVGEPTP